jgi:hypothetical protein
MTDTPPTPERKATAGGLYDADEAPIYFFAGLPLRDLKAAPHRYVLSAADQITGEDDLKERIERGGVVMLDSGAFALAAEHARTHGIPLADAFGLQPEQIDGFAEVFARYKRLCHTYEDELWGYVELDLGGAERKRETRAALESEGLRPIPVYHPMVDGWDYFDELASGYDRIGVGNLVKMPVSDRKRLLMTLWERRRLHTGLRWIHLLGFTPTTIATSLPCFESCDSSWWGWAIRYGAPAAPGGTALNHCIGKFGAGYSYSRASDPHGDDGYVTATRFLSSQAALHQSAWRGWEADRERVFGSPQVPPRVDGEAIPRPAREGVAV